MRCARKRVNSTRNDAIRRRQASALEDFKQRLKCTPYELPAFRVGSVLPCDELPELRDIATGSYEAWDERLKRRLGKQHSAKLGVLRAAFRIARCLRHEQVLQ